jgi:GDP-4-dehydro-6-deoxy-D-mannose reductase
MIDAIISGSDGFIGKALIKQLQELGLDIFATSRRNGDISEEKTWKNFPQAKTVIHLAGKSYVPDSWLQGPEFIRANVLGTEQALQYCRQNNAKMIYISAYVYGVPTVLPISEDGPVQPNNPYAISKLMAERLCEFASRFQQVPVTILRLFNVFGPGQRLEFLIPSIIRQIQEQKEIRVMDLSPRRDYIYINDVVDAILKALQWNGEFNRVNIGAGVSYSVKEIIDIIQAAAGTDLPVISANAVRQQEIPDVIADIQLAKQTLNWSPRYSFKAGIHDILMRS